MLFLEFHQIVKCLTFNLRSNASYLTIVIIDDA